MAEAVKREDDLHMRCLARIYKLEDENHMLRAQLAEAQASERERCIDRLASLETEVGGCSARYAIVEILIPALRALRGMKT